MDHKVLAILRKIKILGFIISTNVYAVIVFCKNPRGRGSGGQAQKTHSPFCASFEQIAQKPDDRRPPPQPAKCGFKIGKAFAFPQQADVHLVQVQSPPPAHGSFMSIRRKNRRTIPETPTPNETPAPAQKYHPGVMT
jgi:hypothetical protein